MMTACVPHKVGRSRWPLRMCPGIHSYSLSTKLNAWYILDVPQIFVWKWIGEKVNEWVRKTRMMTEKPWLKETPQMLQGIPWGSEKKETLPLKIWWAELSCPRKGQSHIPWKGLMVQMGSLCSNFSKEQSNVNVHCWNPGSRQKCLTWPQGA